MWVLDLLHFLHKLGVLMINGNTKAFFLSVVKLEE